YSTTAYTRVSAPEDQVRTVSVYREHSNVISTNSSTKLKSGSFTSRTAVLSTSSNNSKTDFAYWKIVVTVKRNDGLLPSGYDGTFSYTSDLRTWDGSVDITKFYGNNLPAGNYTIQIDAEECHRRYIYERELGGWINIGAPNARVTYSQAKVYNVGTRIEWTDPTYGQSKTTKFYYKSTSSSGWSSRNFTTSGHTNTVAFDDPSSGNYNFRIDYRNGN
ncbi:hypothetical protein, partial [uncultured Microbulbifer sp.]|uniref:hypothetical protein n=1 Tax=uncultured Microbulbifer sp. TaxID=348147 RepID=UPI002638F383